MRLDDTGKSRFCRVRLILLGFEFHGVAVDTRITLRVLIDFKADNAGPGFVQFQELGFQLIRILKAIFTKFIVRDREVARFVLLGFPDDLFEYIRQHPDVIECLFFRNAPVVIAREQFERLWNLVRKFLHERDPSKARLGFECGLFVERLFCRATTLTDRDRTNPLFENARVANKGIFGQGFWKKPHLQTIFAFHNDDAGLWFFIMDTKALADTFLIHSVKVFRMRNHDRPSGELCIERVDRNCCWHDCLQIVFPSFLSTIVMTTFDFVSVPPRRHST